MALLSTKKESLSGHDIASTNPEDIEFGVPLDKRDLGKGWVELEIPEEDADEADVAEGGAKEKKGRGRPTKSLETVNKSPLGAGLKDGAVLAFRWKGDEGWDVDIPVYDDAAEEGGMEE